MLARGLQFDPDKHVTGVQTMNKHTLLISAIGAAAMAASGCAYQGSSGYGSYGAYPASYQTQQTSYAPRAAYRPGLQRTAYVGTTRIEVEASREEFIDGEIINGETIGGVNYNQVEYSDAYKPGYRYAAGLARDINPQTTVLAKGFYKKAEGEDPFVVGTTGIGNVNGRFSDYKSYGAELGLRRYFGAPVQSRLRPYLGATAGAAYIDDINLIGPSGGPLNEAGWVPTASGMAGFEMPFTPRASFALESGVRWTGSQDRTAVASAAGFGDDGSKLSVPVTLRGSFRF